ncbi:MAG TPA: pitrilysin family protein, partial [Candidatus Deferrimicrobium sp.]|nr:pitrilysin family protein [Candidatus Deferrimicrobium sp.]
WADCQRAAEKWLSPPRYVAAIVKPADSTQIRFEPKGLTSEEVIAHFDSISFPSTDLVTGHGITYPAGDTISFSLTDNAAYRREVLPNGMTVIVKSSPDTRVFAMTVFGKNRSATEPANQAGITDFVNRCLEKGTVTRTAQELARDLSKIGATVTLYDNPWIPYDDRYTTRQYSFLKFETVDEYACRGFHLFSEMVLFPAFDSAEVESVRRSMLSTLARNSASPSDVARDLYYQTLFRDRAYANPIMGTPQSLGSISLADLKGYHLEIYAPENMILTIVTNRPADTVMGWINGVFGRLAATGFVPKQPVQPEPVLTLQSAHTELAKEQIVLYLGSPVPGATSDEAIDLAIAASILSDRLYLTLREKQGLAYSVGANAVFDREFGWFYASIGTAAANYQKALDGVILQMEKLKLDGPTQAEVNRARNQTWGSLMSARLSSINQAYYLAVNEYLGREPNYDATFFRELSQVTTDSVRRAASKYFSTDAGVLATAGKRL